MSSVQPAYRVRPQDLVKLSKVKNQIFKKRYIHFVQAAYRVRLWDLVKLNDAACASFYKKYYLGPKVHTFKLPARRVRSWDLVKISLFPFL